MDDSQPRRAAARCLDECELLFVSATGFEEVRRSYQNDRSQLDFRHVHMPYSQDARCRGCGRVDGLMERLLETGRDRKHAGAGLKSSAQQA